MSTIEIHGDQVLVGPVVCPNCGEQYTREVTVSAREYNRDVAHPISITREPCRTCGAPLLRLTGRLVEFILPNELYLMERIRSAPTGRL